ncbi:trypsin-like peptidase domain-containing protein [Pseudoflavonifractor phocaeensis]|uniref:trypsin-like peptidase domain-containing protein n=1 Tax=Pseudoflavonifractor phocaeensis TaxID=1870988 RepID=UPI001958435B|nr:trypsin-like peptidase domain-containing protein [Pseudoflavonifractor phocaeensis]MBM6869482.1 trypsin-like peptidase domain-containing protein [Pseudoflavonifractor phocaeensis]
MNDMNQNLDRNERTQNPEHGAPEQNRPRQKNQGFLRRMAALTLSAALFGTVSAGTFYGVNALLPQKDSSTASISAESTGAVLTSLASTSYSSTRYGMDVSDIAAAALPSVVSITNISVQEVQSFFNRFGPNGAGQTQLQETTSCGSGIIIANDGTWLYMVTNAHVVEDATTLSVSFVDNSVYEAQLCGTDEEVDLAVIKVAVADLSADTLSQIAVIAVGDSDALEVGEQVVAIGNALGYGQSVTTGIVSALNRSLTNESGTTSTYIQTDAAINPGNSGGALLNLDGELIGINTAKLSDTDVEGMGYAIPISDVVELISQLMTQTTDLSQTSSSTTQSSGITGPVWRGNRPAV